MYTVHSTPRIKNLITYNLVSKNLSSQKTVGLTGNTFGGFNKEFDSPRFITDLLTLVRLVPLRFLHGHSV